MVRGVFLLLSLSVLPGLFASYQQLSKIVGNGAFDQCYFGGSLSFSGAGEVLAIGGPGDYYDPDDSFRGAVWIYTQNAGYYTQQGSKLIGSGAIGDTTDFGRSVSLNKAGNILAGGCPLDNNETGAVWIFSQQGGVWSQQGSKIVASDNIGAAQFGMSVALSGPGDLLAIGGPSDNNKIGAVWIFATKDNTTWTQQVKLVGTGGIGVSTFGQSISLSSGGDILAVGGPNDNAGNGAVWIFAQKNGVWSQQGNKLIGTGGTNTEQNQGFSLSLSSNGNILAVGAAEENAVWIWTQTNSVWAQQGSKLIGTGAVGTQGQGFSVALNSAGDTLAVGDPYDASSDGAVWIFQNINGTWSQQGDKLHGEGGKPPSSQGFSVAFTGVADYLAIGARFDNGGVGAVWLFQASNTTTKF